MMLEDDEHPRGSNSRQPYIRRGPFGGGGFVSGHIVYGLQIDESGGEGQRARLRERS